MNDQLEILLKILTVAFAAGGAILVTNWRLNRAEKDREQDEEKRGRDKEVVWSKLHELEKAINEHEKESYRERLKISEKFNDGALAYGRLESEVKMQSAAVVRIENKIDELSKKGGRTP